MRRHFSAPTRYRESVGEGRDLAALRELGWSIDQTDKIDFVTIEYKTGDVLLSISDHLSWDQDEGEHLLMLQAKLNTYLAFV